MKSVDFSRCAFGICAAMVLLSGCGQSPPTVGAEGAAAMMPETARAASTDAGSTFAVANALDNTVTEYASSRAGTALSDARDAVHQLLFDKSGSYLYVVAPGELLVYAPPQSSPLRGLGNHAVGVAGDGSGSGYVADSDRFGVGNVSVYSAGAQALLRTFPTCCGSDLIAVNASGSVIALTHYREERCRRYSLIEYDASGKELVSFDFGCSRPVALAFDPLTGDLYVADTPNRIAGFKPGTDTEVRRIILPGDAYLSGMAFDGNGDLFVADSRNSAVLVYAPTGENPIRTIRAGINRPTGLGLSADGALYVANPTFPGDSVTVYSPAQTSPWIDLKTDPPPAKMAVSESGVLAVSSSRRVTLYPTLHPRLTRTLSMGFVSDPDAVAFDSAKNLYVANQRSNSVTVYLPNAEIPARTITDLIRGPAALALDKSDTLYVANRTSSTVTVYAYGATKPARRILRGIYAPSALAFDAGGNLYVANSGNSTITVYAPGETVPFKRLTDGIKDPEALAIDSADNLYVANKTANTVVVFEPNATHFQVRISRGIAAPDALAFDPSDNLYVANYGNDSVTEYPPESPKLTRTLARGISGPRALAFDHAMRLMIVANKRANSLTFYAASDTSPVYSLETGHSPAAIAMKP